MDDAALDTVTLAGISAIGHHGVFEHERRDGQTFVVDVELRVPTRAAAASDDLADTVDYGQVAADIVAVIQGEPRNLIETVAAEIADDIAGDEKVYAVEVTVHKPAAPIPLTFADVAVIARRSRSGARSVQQ